MKNIILMLALMLTLTANMAKADDFSDGLEAYNNGDYITALGLLKPLAETDHAIAQYSLGVMYDIGDGVLQDDKEAAKWYRMAAEQGLAQAQFNLGNMYANGYGLLQDHKRAHMWWNISRSNGENENAGDNIEIISRIMPPSDILKAQDMARKCVDTGYQDC